LPNDLIIPFPINLTIRILFINRLTNHLMILDPNDPTGFGLFSRYARSRASLVHSYRPNNEIVRKSIIKLE
jgi:hypothetical protein